MVGNFGDYRRRTGGYVGVFETAGDGLWGDDMKNTVKEEASWVKAWEKYQRNIQETAEQNAYCAGYHEAYQEIRGDDAVDRSPPSRAAYGTFAWAVHQMQDGKAVRRRDWCLPITSEDRFAIGDLDVFATDWELYWGEYETPDSPCDSP